MSQGAKINGLKVSRCPMTVDDNRLFWWFVSLFDDYAGLTIKWSIQFFFTFYVCIKLSTDLSPKIVSNFFPLPVDCLSNDDKNGMTYWLSSMLMGGEIFSRWWNTVRLFSPVS